MRNISAFLALKKAGNVKGLLTSVSFVRMSVNELQTDDFIAYWTNKVDFILIREYMSPSGPDTINFEAKKKLFSRERHLIPDFKCNKPWQRLIIRTDGTVLPCCTFFAVHLPMGNIFTSSIEEIWNSEPMKELRALHKKGEFYKNKVCLACAQSCTAKM
jgi:radical SAM protein with 4Fe4S-binding SPASM domain